MITTLALTLLLAAPSRQRSTPPDSIAEIVLRLEAERRAAHLAHDPERLARVLANDFVDVGANGVRRTKEQNVEETRRGVVRWTTLVARNEQVTGRWENVAAQNSLIAPPAP